MCADSSGWTTLHFACTSSNLDLVKYLMEETSVDSLCQAEHPFLVSVQFGSLDVVKYLIEVQHVDINIQDKHDGSAIHLAALQG